MIMAFSQLQSQSFQSLQLVQSGHAFLDERHHPENKIQKKKNQTNHEANYDSPSLIDPPINGELAAGNCQLILWRSPVLKGGNVWHFTNSNAKKDKHRWLPIYQSKSSLDLKPTDLPNTWLIPHPPGKNIFSTAQNTTGSILFVTWRVCYVRDSFEDECWTKGESWFSALLSLSVSQAPWTFVLMSPGVCLKGPFWLGGAAMASAPSGPQAVIGCLGLVCRGTQERPKAPWETADKWLWWMLQALAAAEQKATL